MNALERNTSGAVVPCPESEETAGVTARALDLPGSRGTLAARLYTPASAEDSGLIVFFPSGAFVSNALESESGDLFLRILAARTGYRVLASSYTLAQEAPFPAAVEDAHAVLTWASRQRKKLGWNGKRLITAGLEAGGNLAAVSALMARDRGGPALAAQLLLMPMLDAGLSSCSMREISGTPGAERTAGVCALGYRGYLPRAIDRVHPYASPLQSRRLKDLPPALILSADDDPLRDEAEQYGAKLIGAGVKTLVKRLPPIELEDPNARCSCARKENALQEIACFIASLRDDATED